MRPGLLALALLLCACAGEASGSDPDAPLSGQRLFVTQQCIQCHGPAGHGVPGVGPDLRRVEAFWDADSLVDYLGDPQGWAARDERLRQNMARYRMPMPRNGLTEAQRWILADYVLALE